MRVLYASSRLAIAVLSTLACTVDGPGSRLPAKTVEILPASASGVVGDLATFGVTVRDDVGGVLKNKPVAWSSSNEAVARVSGSGLVEAVGPGDVIITATVDDIVGASAVRISAALTAEPPPNFPPDTLPPPPPSEPPPIAPPSPTQPGAVASVSLVPETMVLGLLGSSQFTAVMRNNQERLLGGRAVTWSVVDGLIAGVNATGLVSGFAAGATTVRATSEGVSATAPLAVALGVQGSPPGWPNLPDGFTPLTDESFGGGLAKFWSLIWNDAGNGSMVADPTAPFSPGRVFQVKYPAGFVAGEAPATLVYKLADARSVFIGIWWKANANWQGHPSNVNKIQFLFPTAGGDMVMVAYGAPGGPYALRCALQLRGADTRDWLRPNADPGHVTMGQWHRIEWLVQFNTPGLHNGVMRWWLNGRLVGDYRDILFPGGALDHYKVSPTWGGIGGAKSQTDYYWYDHVFIAWR